MDMTRETPFAPQLQTNIEHIRLLMGESTDFVVREIAVSCSKRAVLFYLDGMIDKPTLQDHLLAPLQERRLGEEFSLNELKDCILNAGEVRFIFNIEDGLQRVLSGSVLVVLDGAAEAISVAMPGWEDRDITEPKLQTVIRGPQDSFTETIRTNTTLVRRRIKDIRLRLTTVQVGAETRTDVAVMYIQGVANDEMVRQTLEKLSRIRENRVLEGEYLEENLRDGKIQTIFPLFYNTDRPDSIAAGIMEGKIAIFIDGTPFVLLAPALFVDFIQSAEDYYQSYLYSNFIRILRYIALFICLLAPAIYIALTTYHQDMFPTVLLLSLAAQREGVPFPAFVEALIMEVTFEILREAGIRMPRTIGQAVSIVGTIVIGQAAVEASIVSAVMVIVVSITAISSFVIPSYSMSIAIRLLRFIFMGLAAVFGIYGLTIGIILLIIHLCSLHSFGVPYTSPVAPFNASKERDAILRFPYGRL